MKLQFDPPDLSKTVVQGFSMNTQQRSMVQELADHYQVPMSRVIQALIEQQYNEVFGEEEPCQTST